jgi:CRP/FNR family transcriptional regulator, cyclic AMP receptor protein
VTIFDRIPFFAGLAPEMAAAHERHCAMRRFNEGELVLDFDDSSTDIYFVVSGTVRVLVRTAAGKEMIFCDLGPGAVFGELAAIDGTRRSANVTASTSSELCALPAAVFKQIVLAEPAVCERLLKLLSGRIRDLDAKLFERSVLDLRHRLYAELLRLASPRKGAPEQSIVSPPPLHHDLAARVGCRREQVSRELSALIDEGLAEKTKGALVLLAPGQLQRRVRAALDIAE